MPNFFNNIRVPTIEIDPSGFGIDTVSLFVKREDLLHPIVSGNKFRKLKYNLLEAKKLELDTVLTFGGAFSNHIIATAVAAREMGLKSIGIIRGEELAGRTHQNPTLTFAKKCGMRLYFVTREDYRLKEKEEFLTGLKFQLGPFYVIPEGGSNSLAVKGCEEILTKADSSFDYICVSVGTGGTMAGLVRASRKNQKVIGFSALKGTFQTSEIEKYTKKSNFEITDSYCFGGYGKIDTELVRFMNDFKRKTQIPLDPLYTGKMMYGVLDLIKRGYFKENSRILAIHTGGLQGVAGMNIQLQKKKLPLIE